MTRSQQGEPDSGQRELLRNKRPISERKLQANRANAKHSTGPRTEAGKAVARRNALKHGILSRSLNLPSIASSMDLGSSNSDGMLAPTMPARIQLRTKSALSGRNWQGSWHSKKNVVNVPGVSISMDDLSNATTAC